MNRMYMNYILELKIFRFLAKKRLLLL